MSRRATVPAALVAFATLACGAAAGFPRAAPDAPLERRVTIYFLSDRGTAPLAVRATVRRGRGTSARAALERLLRGPTSVQSRAGITTAIPERTAVRSLRVVRARRGSTAFVDLAGLPTRRYDPIDVARIGTQIARTLIGLADIERVRLRSSGRPWGFLDRQGRRMDLTWDYGLLVGLDVGTAKPGTEAVPDDEFSALP